MEENLKRQFENQLIAVKENEEQRRLRDVKQVKEELEMKSLASMNNLRQELLTTHNDQVNRMRQDHQREIERLLSISGEYIYLEKPFNFYEDQTQSWQKIHNIIL